MVLNILIGLSVLLATCFLFALYINKGKVSKLDYALLESKNSMLSQEIEELNIQVEELSKNTKELEKSNTTLIVEKKSLAERIEQHKTDLSEMETKFKAQFENLSNRILNAQTESFKQQSKGTLDNLLSPLQQELKNFNIALQSEGKSKASLEGSIKQIISSNQQINEQAENLVKALKGDTKLQGNWGEIMLEKILEETGLRKGQDYVLQGSGMGLKSPDNSNKIAKPDVVVNLPEDKHIIIDSKISLVDYEKFYTEPNDETKKEHLNKFVKSIKKLIKDLAEKRYQSIKKVNSPEFVLMFLGIESAYSLAIQTNTEILNEAWNKKIVIVCPSTLFATLKTIASVWRLERQNQNAIEIARLGGSLYDKFVGFIDDMQTIGKRLNSTTDAYKEAMNKLSTGRGNLVKKTDDLKQLGIETSKSLPIELIESVDDSTNIG